MKCNINDDEVRARGRERAALAISSPTVTPISGHHQLLERRRKLSISSDYNDIKPRSP